MNISYKEYLYLNSKLVLISHKRDEVKRLPDSPKVKSAFKLLDVLTESIGKRMGYCTNNN